MPHVLRRVLTRARRAKRNEAAVVLQTAWRELCADRRALKWQALLSDLVEAGEQDTPQDAAPEVRRHACGQWC